MYHPIDIQSIFICLDQDEVGHSYLRRLLDLKHVLSQESRRSHDMPCQSGLALNIWYSSTQPNIHLLKLIEYQRSSAYLINHLSGDRAA
jgi:hypothetical protein